MVGKHSANPHELVGVDIQGVDAEVVSSIDVVVDDYLLVLVFLVRSWDWRVLR